MNVRTISTLSEFDALRARWDVMYRADPQASVFVAWPWLRGWFEATPYHWSVLCVGESTGDGPVGFLPISLRGAQHRWRLDAMREVHMAGNPVADFTGMVCRPDAKDAVLHALAEHLMREIRWDRVQFKDVTDARVAELLRQLDPGRFQVRERQGLCTPYVALPATWDEYLSKALTYESRASLRRKMRQSADRFRFTTTHPGEAPDDQIDGLIRLAMQRSREEPDPYLALQRVILKWSLEGGMARLHIMWDDGRVIGGIAASVDDKNQATGSLVTAFDEAYSKHSPGRVINALWIQDAISRGLKEVDFYRGEEEYKFQFGAQRRYTRNLYATRRGVGTGVRRTISRLIERLGV